MKTSKFKLDLIDRPIQIGVVLFVVSNAFAFLTLKSFYWDDWIRKTDIVGARIDGRVAGFPPWREFIEYTVLGNSPTLFHLATPICFLIAAIALNKVLKSRLPLSIFQINAISLLFLLLPLNSARVAMISFYYSFSYMLFFIAWWLLVSKSKVAPLLAIPVFWLSFGTSSLLPFFAMPLLHVGYIVFSSDRRLSRRGFAIWGALASLPVIFWIVRAQTFGANVREYYVPKPLGVIRGGLFVVVAVLFLVYGIGRRKWNMSQNARPLLIGWGVLSLAFGSAAYMAGGHLVDISDWLISFVPNFSDWNSRHQLLQPLGFALIAVGVLSGSSEETSKKAGLFGLSGLLAFSVLLNFTFSQEYYLDSLKQDQVVEQFSNIDALKTNSQVMISDDAFRFNARGRSLRSYEWEAMLEKAHPNEGGFLVEPLRYVSCDEFKPTLILTVVAINGRLESLITRDLGIEIRVEEISPCS